MALFLFFQQQYNLAGNLCVNVTHMTPAGGYCMRKNFIRLRPRVCKGHTDKGDVSIIICMYFIFHAGKSGSLNVLASEGS